MISRSNLFFLIKLILIILQQNLKFCKSEIYSSIHEMTKLVEMESKLLQHLQSFITKNEDKVDYLKERLVNYEHKHNEALGSGPAYFESPENKYFLLKRLFDDWERIQNLMQYNTGYNALKNFKSLYIQMNISFADELKNGIAGFLRIQEVYRLKTSDLAAGKLQGVQYAQEFDARQCFDISIHAIELKLFRLAYSWLIETMRKLFDNSDNLDINETVDFANIYAALAVTKTKLGDIQGAKETYLELLELEPRNELFARTYKNFLLEHSDKNSVEIDYSDEHALNLTESSPNLRHELWKLTCSGYIKKTAKEERELRCGYLTETHPFLKLAPIKVEELNHDPLLVRYYDVLSHEEIEIMKKIIDNQKISSPVSTTQFLLVPKTEDKLLETIDQRIQDMTNLDMNYAEDYQFRNYGIGDLYAEHHDYFHKKDIKENHPSHTASLDLGNRIATVLFYLTDTEQGGGTAYPYLKLLVQPIKGSAIFWHNLHANGDHDVRTLHGGCPVIIGSKLVLNRWIREFN